MQKSQSGAAVNAALWISMSFSGYHQNEFDNDAFHVMQSLFNFEICDGLTNYCLVAIKPITKLKQYTTGT